MFSPFDRGQKRPQVPFICVSEEPLRLDEARLAAWAAALGREQLPDRRPHRGQLPDVDWSRVRPARPGPFARLWRRLRGQSPEGTGVSAAVPDALAETAAEPYLAPEAHRTSAAADEDRRAA